jgi:hypothetical protein|tara:strand:+ start:4243 stop:4461 length:219 start_codon:yes stop_codon:yes gene_type:complete
MIYLHHKGLTNMTDFSDLSYKEILILAQDQADNLKSQWLADIDDLLEDDEITSEEHSSLEGFFKKIIKSPNY